MKKMYPIVVCGVVLLMALTVLSCGGGKEGEAEEPKPPATTTTTTAAKGPITAREAMELLSAKAKGWASDAVPLHISTVSRGGKVEGGKCDYWTANFYSASKKEQYVFNYFQGDVSQAGKPAMQGVDWQVGDLMASWKVDSPQAASIASAQGLADIASMTLSLRQYRPDLNPPQAVPPSCQVYWEIEGEDGRTLYIDAASGEFFGWK